MITKIFICTDGQPFQWDAGGDQSFMIEIGPHVAHSCIDGTYLEIIFSNNQILFWNDISIPSPGPPK